MFDRLNQTLFTLINAPETTGPQAIATATFIAKDLLYIVALIMVVGWVRGQAATRRALFYAGLSAMLGLVINQIIHQLYPHPRPFAAGFGNQFLEHVADTSFPSDHGTILFAVAFGLMAARRGRGLGAVVMLMALATAWARVFLGVHWPLDMVGAFGVGLVSAGLVSSLLKGVAEGAYALALMFYLAIINRLHLPPALFPR